MNAPILPFAPVSGYAPPAQTALAFQERLIEVAGVYGIVAGSLFDEALTELQAFAMTGTPLPDDWPEVFAAMMASFEVHRAADPRFAHVLGLFQALPGDFERLVSADAFVFEGLS